MDRGFLEGKMGNLLLDLEEEKVWNWREEKKMEDDAKEREVGVERESEAIFFYCFSD